MELARITRHEFIPVLDLITLCFKDSAPFSNYSEKDWDKFIPQIRFFIDSGFCYGCYHNSRLFSVIIACNYTTLRESSLFTDFFTANENISTFLDEKSKENYNLIYIPIVCTHPRYRNKGHMHVLLKYFLEKHIGVAYVSNTNNLEMGNIFTQYDFINELRNDMRFYIKKMTRRKYDFKEKK